MGGGPTMYRVIACSADKAADGIAIGFRAGLRLRDMEMVQFHPTGLIVPNSLMTGALLEEGLRGAGGQLLNGRGERFMERYDPKRMERSTRDLVARAWFTEVIEGRGTPHGGVWIDVSHLGAEVVERSFRGMVRRCRDFGYDLARTPVEVGPTTHFMMGGIAIDSACHTDRRAVRRGRGHGRRARSQSPRRQWRRRVHRLRRHRRRRDGRLGGGTSPACGCRARRWTPPRGASSPPLERRQGERVYDLQARLRGVMWDRVGLIRSGEGLKIALGEIEEIGRRAEEAAVPAGGSTTWRGRTG